MNTIIIDDEKPAIDILSRYVIETEGIDIALATADAITGIEYINEFKPDLLLLDIEMPDINGLDLISKLNYKPIIVLTTAYESYALKGYNLDVLDYLLKPISYPRFLKAIDRAKGQYNLINKSKESDFPKSILVNIDYQKVKIIYDDILYIEGLKDYVKIFTNQGLKLTRLSMKGIEKLITHPSFIRVHRSYIVNLDKVETSNKTSYSIGKQIIPIGKSYRKN